MDKHPIQGELEILQVTSCYRNRDKLRLDGLLGSHVNFAYVYLTTNQFKRHLRSRAQFFSHSFIGFDSTTFLCNDFRDLSGCYNQSETYN